MDPLSQAVIGAIAAQQAAARQKSHLVAATLMGLVSGISPDLDIFIGSQTDPLFSLEYHRHFTHSLFFIPIGGLLCALFFYGVLGRSQWFKRSGIGFGFIYLYCTLAVASHGLLDAFTTYGTQLLWPFTDTRVAWNAISIIDPLFTLPLFLLIVTAAIRKQRLFSYIALGWVVIYLGFGIVQRERAEAIGHELAQSRGHGVQDLSAKPSFGNLIVWKIVYRSGNYFYVDAVKVGFNAVIYEGAKVEQLNLERDFPWLDKNSQQASDIERFRWFSNGYIARSPYHPDRIIDMRYSLLPNEIRGLWGIRLDPEKNTDEHIEYIDGDQEERKEALKTLWEMITQ